MVRPRNALLVGMNHVVQLVLSLSQGKRDIRALDDVQGSAAPRSRLRGWLPERLQLAAPRQIVHTVCPD